MDNNPPASTNPLPPPQSPSPSPKVIDLSTINSVNSSGGGGGKIKTKPLIIGILSVLILAVIGIIGANFFLKQPSHPTPKAAECTNFRISRFDGGPSGPGSKAFVSYVVTNDCSSPITYTVSTSFCSYADTSSNPPGVCGDNAKAQQYTVAGNSSSGVTTVEVPVGNNGTCGSSQIDVFIGTDFKTYLGDATRSRAVTALLGPCQYQTCAQTSCVKKDCMVGENCTGSCTSDAQCSVQTHKACQNNACATVNGVGSNSCTSDSDCVQVSHKACVNEACATVSGAGQNQCTSDSDCTTPTHKECNGTSCKVVSGAGQNTCNADADCATVTHKECSNQACKVVNGTGQNQCASDSDCTTPTHKECNGTSCKVVSGPGQNKCDVDNDCSTPTHKECRNNACTSVSGAGSDQCSSDVSCAPAATPPPIPQSGSTAMTLGAIVLGVGAVLAGLFFAL